MLCYSEVADQRGQRPVGVEGFGPRWWLFEVDPAEAVGGIGV